MSALDDLLLKKYRESMGELVDEPVVESARASESTVDPPQSVDPPKMMASSYVSSGPAAAADEPPVKAPITLVPPQATGTYASLEQPDTPSADETCVVEATVEAAPCVVETVEVEPEPEAAITSLSSTDETATPQVNDLMSQLLAVAATQQRQVTTQVSSLDVDVEDQLTDSPLAAGFTTVVEQEVVEQEVVEQEVVKQEVVKQEAVEQEVVKQEVEQEVVEQEVVEQEVVEQEVVKQEAADQEVVDQAEATVVLPTAGIPPFKPDWEIDRFPWPSICDEIEDRVESDLGRALVRISEACEPHGTNTVILTSARSGLGRTTMTLCLAREAARQGKTVAIVDLDHADPCMLECMGIEFEQGIESLQEPGVTVEGICLTAVEEHISLLPAARPFHPTQCSVQETRDMLRTVAQHHDLVLVDASREVADLLVECEDVPTQGVIMVSDPATEQATEAFVEWMKEKNAWTLGVIENFAA